MSRDNGTIHAKKYEHSTGTKCGQKIIDWNEWEKYQGIGTPMVTNGGARVVIYGSDECKEAAKP